MASSPSCVPALACDAAAASRVVGDALRQANSSFLSSGDYEDASTSSISSSSQRHGLFVKERLSLYAAASSACVRCGVAAAVRLAGPLLRLAERDVLVAGGASGGGGVATGSRQRRAAAAASKKRKKDAPTGGASSLLLLLNALGDLYKYE